MKLRNKILVYFSTSVIGISAVSLIAIFILFSEYREEEFQQRQKQKVRLTIELMSEYKKMSENLTNIMDKLTIHDFYDEKMMVFDSQKDLAYSSVDDLNISSVDSILNELSASTQWIEIKEGKYDVIGVYIENEDGHFYAVSKAYDAFGYSHLYFLRNVLIVIFIVISLIVVLISLYLSNLISKPIKTLADEIIKYDLNKDYQIHLAPSSTYEIQDLSKRFQELTERTKEAFLFQKHAVNHISHELKTPIAVLVSELERINSKIEETEVDKDLDEQIKRAKTLGEIINTLLEISKFESGQKIKTEKFRLDEILFDIISELQKIHTDFKFEINYAFETINESKLIINANKMLVKQAFQNILSNSIQYSNDNSAKLEITTSDKHTKVAISNYGKSVSKEERKFLFNHFFRGNNTEGKSGFGLGLIFSQRIFAIYKANIKYSSPEDDLNVFEVIFG